MSEDPNPAGDRAIAEEAIAALVRLARADFSVRLPRTFKKDTPDVLAMFVNVIAEELDRLWKERERQRRDLERGVEQLTEAFVSLAGGDFTVRAPRSGNGDPLDVLGFLLDNTAVEIGEAFSEIDRNRALLETIIDSMVDGVMLLDLDGRVRRANRTAATLLGWTHALEMVGARFDDLASPRSRVAAGEIAAAADGGRVKDRNLVFQTRAGEPITLSVNAAPIHATDGSLEGVVVVARDDRELKRAQAQLQIADRLATMGTLAAGVAHEINNPLAFVTSNIDFVAESLERSDGGALDPDIFDDVMKALRATQAGAERVRLIVRDLRAFSRIEQEAIARVDLPRLLDSVASLIRNEVRHHAVLEKQFDPVPLVEANEPRLVQVFLNLVQNAAHAIPAGAASSNRVRVITRTGESGEAIVEVEDTGTGIAPENIPQLFEAFFTTKPVGVGTGLGLPICQKIVTSFGGRMEVESAIGKGSTFRVVLPPAPPASVDPPTRTRPPSPIPGREGARKRVLVIDDEAEIGEAFARLLGARHDVVIATRGAKALQLVRESAFDIIFCDLMMPEMTGMDFFGRLMREMPDVAERVVFMTGGTFGSGVEEFLASVENERIEKPFRSPQIVALVDSA